jgi:hypothetical protein
VQALLARLAEQRGRPEELVLDNGPEFERSRGRIRLDEAAMKFL